MTGKMHSGKNSTQKFKDGAYLTFCGKVKPPREMFPEQMMTCLKCLEIALQEQQNELYSRKDSIEEQYKKILNEEKNKKFNKNLKELLK